MNLFTIPKRSKDEIFEIITKTPNLKVERIVSYGQTTPHNQPYLQSNNELVFVLQGQAQIIMHDMTYQLNTGDSLLIPQNTKHWVSYTSNNPPVIWLAIHFVG
ncbi:cupin domain-containing protein [Fastidiosibacter lacustris]|uniref:cupin domain-containing protein n=1 Tax=Fastidiosibacter lacustris TaxID=2056695 RepID=UPI000E350001|nr:cupin domain-containing protein [Fastidiosibacter lacustris]